MQTTDVWNSVSVTDRHNTNARNSSRLRADQTTTRSGVSATSCGRPLLTRETSSRSATNAMVSKGFTAIPHFSASSKSSSVGYEWQEPTRRLRPALHLIPSRSDTNPAMRSIRAFAVTVTLLLTASVAFGAATGNLKLDVLGKDGAGAKNPAHL